MGVGRAAHILNAVQFTQRQREVLTLTAEGKNAKEIALILKMGRSTVEHHRMSIMKITHLYSVGELSRLAVRLGLVDTNP